MTKYSYITPNTKHYKDTNASVPPETEHNRNFRPEFLSLDTTDILGPIILCCG